MATGLTVAYYAVVVGSAAYSAYSSYEAKEMQEEAQAKYEERVKQAQEEAEQESQRFLAEFEREQEEYDPYDVSDYMASVFEGVLRPMEVEFEEDTMAELDSIWNTGAFGSAMTTGAAKKAEQEARRDLSLDKASVRASARNDAISQAASDYDRRVRGLQIGHESRMGVINAQFGQAAGIYGAAQDSASAHSAFGASVGALGASIGGGLRSTQQHEENLEQAKLQTEEARRQTSIMEAANKK
jgi:hypothetical protein